MKILITGGAGYIGSHTIVEMLAHTDWEIVSVDNYSNSSEQSYERIQAIAGKSISYYNVDLRDFDSLSAIFEEHEFDGVMHFAAMKAVGESVDKPLEYYESNLGGLINLLKCQDKFKVGHHLYSSSCTVYGTPESLPVTESNPIGKTESPYGYTKVAGERILEDTSSLGRIKTLALRYFNPVGAHPSGRLGELPLGVPNNLVPYITQTAAGHREELTVFGDDYETRDGTCIRDYIHVCDIAYAHVLGMKRLIQGDQDQHFDFINLGTGNGVSVQEIIDAFKSVNQLDLNVKVGTRRPGDIPSIYADNSKARNVLNWSAKHDLESMMESAWKWQQHLDNQSL